jgi:outer membrane protein assembly factor BamB
VGADVDGSPVVAADGTIVVGADGGRISALDPDDGSLRWAFAAEKDVRSGIARGPDDTLFATSLDGRLYALGPGGRVRFIVPTEGPIASTPVIDAAGNVFFGSRDDRLYAVASAGEVLWNVELPDDIDGGVAISSAGTIVVGCDDGHLRGLR